MDIKTTIQHFYIRIQKEHTTFHQSHYEQQLLMGEKVTWTLQSFGDDGQWHDVAELGWVQQVQDIKWQGNNVLTTWRSPACSIPETAISKDFHSVRNEFEARSGTTTTYLAPPATYK